VNGYKKDLTERADAVVTLIRMRAYIAAPRILKLLLARQDYCDELDRCLVGFFKLLPTPEAIPFLLEYQRIARENDIAMSDKVHTVFVGALKACEEAEKVM
jgi:hypothetical protein